ncbi:MAG: hypothetical protein ACRD92_08000 [Nitrosopumilaceae archaeon]
MILLLSSDMNKMTFGSGWYPCCVGWSLDKIEYQPGDTVRVLVTATDEFEHSNETVVVKISDVTYGPDYASVVFEDQKALQDGKVLFEYKLPQKDSDRYRYQVFVDTPAEDKSKIFFTKKDASKIVISDLKVLNPVLKQGEPIRFESKVVDGVGNPAHYLRILVTGDIPHQLCSTEIAGSAGAYLDVSPLYSLQPDYWSAGIIKGQILIMNTAKPGLYNLTLYASGDIEGYQNEQKSFPITIEQYDGHRDSPYSVFTPFNFKFQPGFMTEQTFNFTGQTAYNGCGPPLPNVPIKVEIKKYDLKSSKWLETVATQNVVSDENGYYHVYFDPIGLQAGYFSILFTTDYPGVNNTFGIETPYNTKNFTINAEGKEFVIETDTWYSIPLNVEFSQKDKKLTFDVDTSDSLKRITLSVPHELLDGEFVIFVNGVERTDIGYNKIQGYTIFGLESNTDKTHIEIIGTSAIPEFPVAGMILIASITAMMITTRTKWNQT